MQVGTLNYMSPEAILGGTNNIRGAPPMKVCQSAPPCLLHMFCFQFGNSTLLAIALPAWDWLATCLGFWVAVLVGLSTTLEIRATACVRACAKPQCMGGYAKHNENAAAPSQCVSNACHVPMQLLTQCI